MTTPCFDQSYDYLFKVLLIGDTGVGKTSVVHQYSSGTFLEKNESTIGVDFFIKTLEVDDKLIKLQIWDTAGQERFRTITQSFYRGAYGVVTVYDITNYSTFESISEWLDGVKRNASRSNLVNILVGNKCDLGKLREVDSSEAKTYADTNGFFTALETSAKTNANINDAFFQLAKELKKRFTHDSMINPNSPDGGLSLSGHSISRKAWTSCCGGSGSHDR